MEIRDMISRRKSVRSYENRPVEVKVLERIQAFDRRLTPLYPHIRVKSCIVSREQVRCFLPWVTPQLLAIYSTDEAGALENAGFMYQQMDLYMQSLGLGTCWLGMGRMDRRAAVDEEVEGLRFVMLLAFGYPKGEAWRTDISQFKRKPMSAISDREDPMLEPARLAPSSVNSQPWYFVHRDDGIHVYCVRQGLLRNRALGEMNRMDMGIALAHLYVSRPDSFCFFRAEHAPEVKGYAYIGSVAL